VLAYAAALSKADSDRNVSATLFFTDVDSAKTWNPMILQMHLRRRSR